MMSQVDEKPWEITTVEYDPITSNRISPGKNRDSVIRERFAAQTLRDTAAFSGFFMHLQSNIYFRALRKTVWC